MMRIWSIKPWLILFLLSALLLSMPCFADGQRAIVINGNSDPKVGAEERAEIIDKVCESLNEVYVFPDKAKEMEVLVRKKLKEGGYAKSDKLAAFTIQLTEDLHSVCRDLHLRVVPMPDSPAESAEAPSPEEQRRQRLEESCYNNFGFQKVEMLPGNIGYLDLRGFYEAGEAGATAVAAMNFLAHGDALIIDLRQNGGGSPSMIQLISSYFFDEPVHLNSFYIRRTDETKQFWTQAQVLGPRMSDVPIYVLTSNRTFSAAEEFTYNLKNMERATIIGETTGGGAHPVTFHSFPGLKAGISVPFGRAVNPITGTNWEGVGIEPHIAVPADEALEVAQMEALKKVLEKETRRDRKERLEWALKTFEARRNPVTLDEAELEPFAGLYGPREIMLEDGCLFYHREGRPKYRMVPMGGDLFMLKGLDYFRIRFERASNGRVTKLIGLYDNGTRDGNERTSG